MEGLHAFLRSDYDYVIIECGLQHELLTNNALVASELLHHSGASPFSGQCGNPGRTGHDEAGSGLL